MCCCHISGGPGSPFENNWHLKPEFKNYHKRKELADRYVFPLAFLFEPTCAYAQWALMHHFASVIRRKIH